LKIDFSLIKDKFKGRLFTPAGPPPKLGDEIVVTVKRTGFNLEKDQIQSCLSNFGSVKSKLKYKSIEGLPGFKEDTLEVSMTLEKHIPSILPLFGKKLFSQYKGQPILCNNCYKRGHVRKNCTAVQVNWEDYVRDILSNDQYPTNLLGTWKNILEIEHKN